MFLVVWFEVKVNHCSLEAFEQVKLGVLWTARHHFEPGARTEDELGVRTYLQVMHSEPGSSQFEVAKGAL